METFLKYSELPNFLKFRIDSWYEPSATPSYTAFVEGWGQYAEHLGYEMKVFDEDPYQVGISVMRNQAFSLVGKCHVTFSANQVALINLSK